MKSIIYSTTLVLGLSAIFSAMVSGQLQRAGGAVASASEARLADLASLAGRLPRPAGFELPWAASDEDDDIAATDAPAVQAPPTSPRERAQTLTSQIGNTGGHGVSLRSDCVSTARLPGSIGDGESVAVVATGEGRCVGWSLVQRGATGSWVEDRFLLPPGAQAVRAPGPPPVAPSIGGRSFASDAEPPSPTAIWFGRVDAPKGATLSIWIHGQRCTTATVFEDMDGGRRYRISVAASAPCAPQAGSLAIFTADGLVVPAETRWQPGVILELDLVPR